MDWLEVSFSVAEPAALEGMALMVTEICGGVLVDDPQAIAAHVASNVWDAHEFAAEVLATQAAVVKGYLAQNEALEERLLLLEDAVASVAERMNMAVPVIQRTLVQEEDWANAWKVYFKPERIGKRTVIKPSWEDYTPQEDDLVIEIDPGMAFGTGNHATTALCIQALEDYVQPGMQVFDVGTGSGILAVQAALLGAEAVQAMDFDLVAVAAAKENIALNHLSNVNIGHSDLLAAAEGKADLIVANIVADIIIRAIPQVLAHLQGPKLFIASGIIEERKADVTAALEEAGLSVLEVREDKGWVAIISQG